MQSLNTKEWQQKIQLYRDATSDPGNGILPVSSSWAKKHILGFSDEEIKLDLQQQRIERAVAGELEKTQEVITSTGIFDNLDKLYGDKNTDSAEVVTLKVVMTSVVEMTSVGVLTLVVET